ncbi:hypothetical protein FRC10_008456 [Ceratobasidium sp. 414]|nr:hypothetical protein FRC10_008456 [Ceratobasidium sp. 414]
MTSFDSELDALFKSSAGASHVASRPAPVPIPVPIVAPLNPPTKRKHTKSVSFVDSSKSKRPRNQTVDLKGDKTSKKQAVDSSDEDNDPAIEDAYRQPAPSAPQTRPKPVKKDEESDSESDPDAPPPTHESLLPQSEKPSRRMKFVPEGETPEQRDARTIFVGNLPASAAKSSTRKALQKHILRHLVSAHPDSPKPAIESSRFRSIAFKTPTSKLPSDALTTPKSSKPPNHPTTSEHNRARAAEWRAVQDPEGGSHKTFQTPAQKKKTAFITGALHDSSSSSASAYVVFAYPAPVEGQEPPWDPVEVAARAVKACNGTVFMERTLRVDRVRPKGATGSTEGVGGEGEKADPRTMVFVGNLDFEVHEDAVRQLFEKLVEKERQATKAETAATEAEESGDEGSGSSDEDSEGAGQDDDESEDESEGEPAPPSKSTQPSLSSASTTRPGHHWVKSVRIIRDKDTQLGKGFAYVQFHDRVSADEILAMEPGTIKLAKRKLRIQRCKTLPGVTLPKPKQKEHPSPAKPSHPLKTGKSHHASAPLIPRVDPALGDRLRSLSKDERKVAKSSDADRVARRLAKKKTRVLMERGVRKAAGKKDSILGGRAGGGKGKVVKGGKGKRERSDKSILKKNVKK